MTCDEQDGCVQRSNDDQNTDAHTARIRQLNDWFRTTLIGGRVMLTAGVGALPPPILAQVIDAVRSFTAFTPDNDPFDEHDFGAIDIAGKRMFWKIDCYDLPLEYGSPDAAVPSVTQRVMTVMLASEY